MAFSNVSGGGNEPVSHSPSPDNKRGLIPRPADLFGPLLGKDPDTFQEDIERLDLTTGTPPPVAPSGVSLVNLGPLGGVLASAGALGGTNSELGGEVADTLNSAAGAAAGTNEFETDVPDVVGDAIRGYDDSGLPSVPDPNDVLDVIPWNRLALFGALIIAINAFAKGTAEGLTS